MPVVGVPTAHGIFPVWRIAVSSDKYLFLADRADMHLFSLGDMFIMAGVSISILLETRKYYAKNLRVSE